MSKQRVWMGVVVAGLAVVVARSIYVVDESELALEVSFGRVIRTQARPGLKIKWPWHSVRRFDRRVQLLDPEPRETLTGDPKNIVIDPYACWRIDPSRLDAFVRTVRDAENAGRRLSEVIWHQLTVALSGLKLAELVNEDPAKLRQDAMLAKTLDICQATAAGFGIQLLDIQLKRVTRPAETKDAVYSEMIAERRKVANYLRKEGERRAIEIRAQAREEADRIKAQAEGEAQIIRGRGEAEATRIYGAAHSQDPEFFLLQQLLDTYRTIIDSQTTLVLSGDSDLLRLLTEGRVDALPQIERAGDVVHPTTRPAEPPSAPRPQAAGLSDAEAAGRK